MTAFLLSALSGIVIIFCELLFVNYKFFSTTSNSDFSFNLIFFPLLFGFFNFGIFYLYFALENKGIFIGYSKFLISIFIFFLTFVMLTYFSGAYKYLIYPISTPSNFSNLEYGFGVKTVSEGFIFQGEPYKYVDINWEENLSVNERLKNITNVLRYYEDLSSKEDGEFKGESDPGGIQSCKEEFDEAIILNAKRLPGRPNYVLFSCRFIFKKVIKYKISFNEYGVRIRF